MIPLVTKSKTHFSHKHMYFNLWFLGSGICLSSGENGIMCSLGVNIYELVNISNITINYFDTPLIN